jgi:oxygen-independent coproporphyrinogen-3 oxidase
METALEGRTREPEWVVAGKDLAFEYILNALRLPRGFETTDFTARTGLDPSVLEPGLEVALARGLIERTDGGGLRPTPLGMRFLNDLQSLFLPSPATAAG